MTCAFRNGFSTCLKFYVCCYCGVIELNFHRYGSKS
jgi:hypothetical protein